MANNIKISELIPKGAPLSTTDLLMISQETPDGFESNSITGAEIIESAQEGLQPLLVSGTSIKTINGTSLLGSGDISITASASWGSITGTLSSQTDLQSALDSKQATLVSGTNIKTINGSSLLGSGDITISGSNIYTADGTLTGARTLTLGGVALTISGTTSSRFQANGNVGIGTTTDAGYKLDVNGTARVSGTINVTQTSGNVFRLTNGTYFHSTAGGVQTIDYYNGFVFQNAGQVNIKSSFGGNIRFLRESIFGTDGANNASAQVQIDSTTKGFLPPRMTTTQKNAIASPTAGLIVYDTTLNKLCVYTTAWETITSA
jgi:hypothetical protein